MRGTNTNENEDLRAENERLRFEAERMRAALEAISDGTVVTLQFAVTIARQCLNWVANHEEWDALSPKATS